jgi:endoglucanase
MKALTVSVVFFLCCFFIPAQSQDFLKRDGKKIVNARGENILLRGIGLGGWMLQEGYMLGINKDGQQHLIKQRIEELIGKEKTEIFYNTWLANHTTKADIDSMRSWGFNSVRLPMHYNLYTLSVEQEPVPGRQTWIEKGFKITDDLVAWCKANKMYLILDLHAAPGGQGNDNNISDRDPSKASLWESEANRQKTIALWKKLAERYKNEPTIAGYDIINEPNWGFEDTEDKNGLKEKKNEPLEKLLRDITSAIREADTNHLIIIEGNGWGNNYNGILDDGLWDSNMALSFHKYWNYNDPASIAHIIKYRDDYNVPVWLGETGENSNVWFTQAIHLLESNNIGWAWWPLKKLGYNNPLQIKKPERYQQVLDYWNGSIKKPLDVDFSKSLMALATNTNIKYNILHRDVIDAMIRQPFSNETKPFKLHLVKNGSVINAADYDLGKNGFAYYDLDTANYRVSGKPGVGNKGGTYRNDGVDIFKEEKTGDIYVGSIEDGEWLQYSFTINTPGVYKLEATISAKKEGKILLTLIDADKDLSTETKVPVTGAGISWTKLNLGNIKPVKGLHTIRIKAVQGGFDLKEMKLVRQGN